MKRFFFFILSFTFSSLLLGKAPDESCPQKSQSLSTSLQGIAETLEGATPRLPASSSLKIKEAAIYGEDNRKRKKTDEYPWRTIGSLNVGFNSCTAVLVSSCHLLTAGHCFPGLNSQKKLTEQSGPISQTSFTSSNGKTTARPLVAEIGPGNLTEDPNKDYGFVLLDKPIGKELGHMGVVGVTSADIAQGWMAWSLNKKREDFFLAAYAGDVDQGETLVVDDKAQVIRSSSQYENIAELRANTFVKSSGAPLWRIALDGTPEIVGVTIEGVTAHDKNHPEKVQQVKLDKDETRTELLGKAVASQAFFKALVEFMKRNPCPN